MGALAISCNKGPDDIDGKDDTSTTVKFTTVSDAVYRGELKAEGTGFFTFTLSNDNGDKMRVDCFGAVALNAANPRFTTGTYNAESIANPTIKTFITAENAAVEEGTIYWKNNEAYPINDGSIIVAASGSNYKITIKVKSGDKDIEATYEGALKFESKPTFAPRVEDPNPRPVSDLASFYYGKMRAKAETALFSLSLLYKSDDKTTEALQITGFIPAVEDKNTSLIPEGTYKVAATTDTMDEFTILPGSVTKDGYADTCESYTDKDGGISKGYIISEGTLVVSKTGDNYKITANFKGKRADRKTIIGTELENVVYEYEGPMEPMVNKADAPSSLTEDVDLGTFSHQAFLQIAPLSDNSATGWFYYLWDEGIGGEISGDELHISGVGNTVLIAIAGKPQGTDLPVGEFPMSDLYGYQEESGSAWPANTDIVQFLPNLVGCMYANVRTGTDGILHLEDYMGAVPNKGFVKTSTQGDVHTVEFEFYDINGYKVTGKYQGAVEISKGSKTSATAGVGNSMFYTPAFKVAADFLPASEFPIVW